jgi:hypothetical protein
MCFRYACLAVAMLAGFAGPAMAQPAAQRDAQGERSRTEWSESDAKAARERDEARQRTWDKKMRDLSKSICTGC